MKNSTIIWAILAFCGLLITGAMAWFTWKVRDLEHERAFAEARADLGERSRLALWRMDAAGAAIVLGENRRAPDAFLNGAVLNPNGGISPFLLENDPLVRLHFEFDGSGALRSPEIEESWASNAGLDAESLAIRKRHFGELQELLRHGLASGDEGLLLHKALDVGESTWQAVPKEAPEAEADNTQLRQQQGAAQVRRDIVYQKNFSGKERAQRAKVVEQTVANTFQADNSAQQQQIQPADPQQAAQGGGLDAAVVPGRAAAQTRQVVQAENFSQALDTSSHSGSTGIQALEVRPMRAVWISDELFLLRFVTVTRPWSVRIPGNPATHQTTAENRIQGAWMDADAVKQRLLGEVADLLPKAELMPGTGGGQLAGLAAEDPLALVSFPLRLRPREWPELLASVHSPSTSPLLVSWIAVLLALAAAAVLVRGVMRLSERRASFVSSVTHELRTPLTTFRLYSDLLAEGMVRDPKKQADYLRTMRSEADRLHHLVENVLAYSRIERGSARAKREQVALGDLLERMQDRLDERAAAEGMSVEVICGPDCQSARLHTDVTAVGQIIFNLVDNACKYGRPDSGAGAIRVTGAVDHGHAIISVRDEGPGVAATEAARMFRPFHKSAAEAAASKPGVGLGLALSRRLARALGGDLVLANPGNSGAEFQVTLGELAKC